MTTKHPKSEPFDPSCLSDGDLILCLEEMRRRDAAVMIAEQPTTPMDRHAEALALLRSIHSDIEACRNPDGFEVDGTVFDWPNLSIMSCMIEEFLNGKPTAYGEPYGKNYD